MSDHNIRIVDAHRDHAPFLGWVLQTASRSHLERGALDIFVAGSDDDCLQFLRAWPLTEARHWANFENFIVIESDGNPAGALCGYFLHDVEPLFGKGAVEVAVGLGW